MGIFDEIRKRARQAVQGVSQRTQQPRARIASRVSGRAKHENYTKILDYIKRQAAKGSPMHQYMLNKYNEYISQGVDFQTAVRKARQGGIIFQANQR